MFSRKNRTRMLLALTTALFLNAGLTSESWADIIASGDDCAADDGSSTCHWEVDSSGKLTITGSGAMKDNFGNTKREDNTKVNSGTTTNASWGDYHSTITSIEIGEGITDTGGRSFQGLANVTSVSIPKSLETIGVFAFDRMPDMNSFNVPEGSNLTNFSGNGAFHNGGSLTNTDAQKILDTMAANNKAKGTTFDIPMYTFYESGALGNIVIPEGVTSIGDQAFRGNNLGSVIIPSSVTNVGEAAFYDNQLETVNIPDGVTDLGAYAFSHNSLTSVDIPESVTSMGNWAFGNNQLTEVTIPSGLTSLNEGVFGNNQLTTVDIPEGITSIGDVAFSGNQLSEVIFPEGLISIGEGAFQAQGYKDENGNFVSTLTSIEFPGTLEDIGSKAFFGAAFTTLDIPDSLKNIGHGAFYGSILEKLILPDTVDFGGTTAFNLADENAIVLCRGNFEDCRDKLEQKNLISQFWDLYYTEDGGLYVEFSGVGEFNFSNYGVAKDADCNTANYYYDGSRCVYEPNPDSRTCEYNDTGYIKVGDYCASPETTYAKKKYTPAEANQWLKDDDNYVVITFKK